MMISPFSFKGELDRRSYVLGAGAAFFAQHAFVASAAQFLPAAPLHLEWWFWINPFRVLGHNSFPSWIGFVAMGVSVAAACLMAAFSFRRAQHAGAPPALAALAIVPILQIAPLVWLGLAPRRKALEIAAQEPEPDTTTTPARTIAQGVLAGVALSVVAVGLSATVLKTYGYSLFVLSPFVIGVTTGFIANRNEEIGGGPTLVAVLLALALGALALVMLAFEGLICLVVAFPLIALMGWLGGMLGAAFARARQGRISSTTLTIAALPLLLFAETLAPPRASFESVESVEVDASPREVWDAITHMGAIPEPPAAPFNWGLAYPVAGEIDGEGVGAVRRGVFSTGVAYERVTEWAPERKLSFIVLSDPPTMRELSPYDQLNAPHLTGYFRTLDARFTITPLDNGKTRLTLATAHELDLEPALYWIPFAQWAVHANKTRVLQHFRAQAERAT